MLHFFHIKVRSTQSHKNTNNTQSISPLLSNNSYESLIVVFPNLSYHKDHNSLHPGLCIFLFSLNIMEIPLSQYIQLQLILLIADYVDICSNFLTILPSIDNQDASSLGATRNKNVYICSFILVILLTIPKCKNAVSQICVYLNVNRY